MPTVIPAIQGRLGSITYYQGMISARDLVSAVRPANESDKWATWSIEERMQRELDEKRIQQEIIPYLAKSPDRFFGSVIVLVYRANTFEWESMDVLSKLPAAYRGVGRKIGILTVDGGELIVLDGQHRVVALRNIITGKDRPEGEFVNAIPGDELSVIFIQYEGDEKTRRIFNKVNRYAKPTSRGDNIITSEDDGCAILTRWLMRNDAPFGYSYTGPKGDDGLIVDWKNNTITGRSQKFTTVSVLYETVKEILAGEQVRDFDEKSRVVRPAEEELKKAYERVAEWWADILESFDPYRSVMDELKAGKPPSCAEKRQDDARSSLLFKPAGQIALVKGLVAAVARGHDAGFTRKDALRRANRINWSAHWDAWKGTIVTMTGRMSASKGSYELAGELIAYLIGAEFMSKKQIDELRSRYNEARGYSYEHPEPGTKPTELPKPAQVAATAAA
jgi:DNA sulfur modification protein DndB